MPSWIHPRAASMLSLTIPAIIVGIGAAIVLVVVVAIANVIQHLLWNSLPPLFGATTTTWWWVVLVLTLAGVATGLVVRFVPGHAGGDPATLELFAPPNPLWVLPGIGLALVITLASGVSLGPENPILAIAIGLAVAIGPRFMPSIQSQTWMMLAAAGMIGAMFGTAVAAALLFSETLGGNKDRPLWDQLFAPLMAAATGAVVMRLLEQPDFALQVPAYGNPNLIDLLSGALIVLAASGVGMLAVWAFPLVHGFFHAIRHPVLMLGLGGFVLGILGVVGGPITMFKGLPQMQELVATAPGYTAWGMLAVLAIKLLAIVISASAGFRGGRIFPMVFAGVAFGLLVNQLVPAVPVSLTLAASVLGFTLVATRDGWLSLFMASVMVPGLELIPVLCVLLLPAWLVLAGQPPLLIEAPENKAPPEGAAPDRPAGH